MQLLQSVTAGLLLAGSCLSSLAVARSVPVQQPRDVVVSHTPAKITPKVFIVSMFAPEAEIWWGIPEFDLLAHNITIPGASPAFPDVHCTADYTICQLITGESEINAAITVASVVFNPMFDLTKTYFLVAGIAGVNPERASICDVTFARFAIQVALQYEIDMREMPANATTGYFPQGGYYADQYPTSIYGTEVFEVNDELRKIAAGFARNATLADSDDAKAYRAKYATEDGLYKAGTQGPSVRLCDVTTSDVYFSGRLLGEAFDNTTKIWTNGTGEYCTTAQEDNATLEALVRASKHNLTDFSRIIVMRTASDFDRPYPGETARYNLLYSTQGAFEPAVENLYNAGIKIVEGILANWNSTFAAGIKPRNYLGDIFGTLGATPDYGPGRAQALEEAGAILKKRSMGKRFVRL
ncbi:putative purine nucleoside permease [Aspergillus uvarum CBS 121591]|uniref:Putative purine nucleoside permease n=1 Tax=Aspergillus uvarum CBS 121591 TaxID=1448315 RepID=A0A319E5J5_9EURO|nr:putative purine nucleoside permease [Aspergillus uvarum CBS 121591]PYH86412.1 putative purine nucleoside permease [Aspergillus uvarum CBS 121591]